MWKNKHVIVALIVAPILAILAWFGVGQIVGEKAHVAKPGAAYPLVARSNCRWESGACELANNDVAMTILPLELGAQYTKLSLDAEFPLTQATFALLSNGNEVVANAEHDNSPDAPAQMTVTILPLELGAQYTKLSLDAEFPLTQATFALLVNGNEVVANAEHDNSPDAPAQMTVTIPAFADPEATLRVAVTVEESLYFAEVPVVFMRPEKPRFSR